MTTSEQKIPADLRKALSKNAQACAIWKDLTPIARRDFITWIESAKKEETRKRRVESVPSRLLSGKRRPCCYALVPMNLYKALGTNKKAKDVWNALTPDERRNFVGWIDEAKNSALRGIRIEEVCAMLTKGKKQL